MSADRSIDLINVNENNVTDLGFFCLMSRKKSEGYKRKLNWLKKSFNNGLKIRMLGEGQRGFIEYLPAEYAWRPIVAPGYMFIHCLWVVGKSKGNGYGEILLDDCLESAEKLDMNGVVMVSSKKTWLADNKIFIKKGFESVDQAPPSFDLMVKKLKDAPTPAFSGAWEEKAKKYGRGLTVVRTDQCPYIEDATTIIIETANELGIKNRVVELRDHNEVREKSPSAYGTFGVVYNGRLLSYHWLTKKELIKRIEEAG